MRAGGRAKRKRAALPRSADGRTGDRQPREVVGTNADYARGFVNKLAARFELAWSKRGRQPASAAGSQQDSKKHIDQSTPCCKDIQVWWTLSPALPTARWSPVAAARTSPSWCGTPDRTGRSRCCKATPTGSSLSPSRRTGSASLVAPTTSQCACGTSPRAGPRSYGSTQLRSTRWPSPLTAHCWPVEAMTTASACGAARRESGSARCRATPVW